MNIKELKELNKAIGHKFFDKKTMNYWHSKIHGNIVKDKYFVTSEDNFDHRERLYTVRSFNAKGEVFTASEFQQFRTLKEAQLWIELQIE